MRSTLAVLGALAVLFGAGRAHAEVLLPVGGGGGTGAAAPPALSLTRLFEGPIPTDGAVLLYDESNEPFVLGVQHTLSGAWIEGQFQQVYGSYWAWKANAPMVVGEYVIATLAQPVTAEPVSDGLFISPFEVVDTALIAPPTLVAAPAVSTQTGLEGLTCCSLWTELGIEQGTCAAIQERTSVLLEPGVTSPDPLVSITQFLYRRWPAGEDPAPYGYTVWGAMPSFSIAEGADEYCYEIEALSINDLSIHRYDELAGRCAPHGSLPEVSVKPIELPPDFFDRARCTNPPPGEEAAWCEANADCADTPDEYACSLFDNVCNGGPTPEWAPPPTLIAGAGGAGGAGARGGSGGSGGIESGGAGGAGAGGAGGAGAGGAAGMTEVVDADDDGVRRSSGCSAAAAGSRSGSSWAWAALGVACALACIRRRRAAQLIAGIGLFALGPQHAHALPAIDTEALGLAAEPLDMPTGPSLASPQPVIPGNGALLFIDYGGSTFSLVVTSPTGESVEGTYAQVYDTYWAWRPSSVLSAGTYLIESTDGPPLHQRNLLISSTFEVVEAVDLAPPALMSAPSASALIQSVDQICCERWTDFGVEQGACASTAQETYASIEPGLSSSASAMALSQFLFTIWLPDTPHVYAPWSVPRSLIATIEAEEYCFEASALAIFDGSEHLYEELSPRCVPHGELGELGRTEVEIAESFFDREACTEPPDALDEAWCEHNADCEDSDEPSCVMFEYLCNGGERPMWNPPTGMGGFGGAFGGAGGFDVAGSGAGVGGEGGDSGDAGMQSSGGEGGSAGEEPTGGGGAPGGGASDGCSVSRAARGGSGAWCALLIAALALHARRRLRAGSARA